MYLKAAHMQKNLWTLRFVSPDAPNFKGDTSKIRRDFHVVFTVKRPVELYNRQEQTPQSLADLAHAT